LVRTGSPFYLSHPEFHPNTFSSPLPFFPPYLRRPPATKSLVAWFRVIFVSCFGVLTDRLSFFIGVFTAAPPVQLFQCQTSRITKVQPGSFHGPPAYVPGLSTTPGLQGLWVNLRLAIQCRAQLLQVIPFTSRTLTPRRCPTYQLFSSPFLFGPLLKP